MESNLTTFTTTAMFYMSNNIVFKGLMLLEEGYAIPIKSGGSFGYNLIYGGEPIECVKK